MTQSATVYTTSCSTRTRRGSTTMNQIEGPFPSNPPSKILMRLVGGPSDGQSVWVPAPPAPAYYVAIEPAWPNRLGFRNAEDPIPPRPPFQRATYRLAWQYSKETDMSSLVYLYKRGIRKEMLPEIIKSPFLSRVPRRLRHFFTHPRNGRKPKSEEVLPDSYQRRDSVSQFTKSWTRRHILYALQDPNRPNRSGYATHPRSLGLEGRTT
jgi:hypothetical protein